MKRRLNHFGMALGVFALSIFLLAGAALAGNFKAEFAPAGTVYKVGQKVQFKVKANQDFYLYLFSIDQKQNRGVVLLPNKAQRHNKFAGGKTHLLPGDSFSIVPNRVGTERVIMVASTRKLSLRAGRMDGKGDFLTGSAEQVEQEAKALTVQAAKAETVIKEATLVIIGN